MRKFWQCRKGLIVFVGVELMVVLVAAGLYAQQQGGRGPGDWQNRMAMGTVQSVKGNQIVVKGWDGQNRTVVVGKQATVTRFVKGSKADLKKNKVVRVMGQYDQKRAWFIPQFVHVGQGVQSMGGPGGMLMGVGQIYNVQNNQVFLTLPMALSNETKIVRGDAIQANQVKKGESIFAMGEPGQNNTVNAQRVMVGDQESMQMGGGMMGGGGRPGGRPGGGQGGRSGGR